MFFRVVIKRVQRAKGNSGKKLRLRADGGDYIIDYSYAEAP